MIKKAGILLCMLLLWGCSNRVKDMESYYQSGQYLEAGKCAIESLKDPELSPQTLSFLKKNGDMLLEKSLYQADILLKSPDGNAIYYLNALIPVLEEIHLLGAPLSQLDTSIKKAEKKLVQAKSYYVDNEYNLAQTDIAQKSYRKAIGHLKNVQTFSKNYTPTLNETLLLLSQKATQVIFIKLTPPNTSATQIYDVHVSRKFNNALLENLKKNKSEYLNFTVERLNESEEKSSFEIYCTLETAIIDQAPQITQTTDWVEYTLHGSNGTIKLASSKFNYVLFTAEYRVSVYVQASIYSSKTQTKLKTINFEKSESEKSSFRSPPSDLPFNGYPYRFSEAFKSLPTIDSLNRTLVTEKALNHAAEELAIELLTLLDKEHPFQ